MSNRQRIRRQATNGNGRGHLVETSPKGVESDYYDQIVRCEGVRGDGETLVVSQAAFETLAHAWAILAGIRGYFRPAETPEFCRSFDETLRFIDHLTDKIVEAKTSQATLDDPTKTVKTPISSSGDIAQEAPS